MHIYALSPDLYWLTILKNIEIKDVTFTIIQCPAKLHTCLDYLPSPETDSLILLDASSPVGIEEMVKRLRDQGWRYVIVVAADQNAKKAIAILRSDLAFDYWEKTYDILPIQAKIAIGIDEIRRDREN